MPVVYRGDTLGKQMARQTGYQLAIADIGFERFSEEPHIVVASQHCGDIVNYLFPRGIIPANILACDIDPLAMVAADKLGVLLSPHPDIRDTVKWAYEKYGEKIATLNFDLCHTVLRVDLLEEALRYTPIKTTVLYTFMRGRDGMYSLQERLIHLTQKIRANIQYLNYQSNSDESVGSPMCMTVLNAVGDNWFWEAERDPDQIKVIDLDTNRPLRLVGEITVKANSRPAPKIIAPTVEKLNPPPLSQTDDDRKIEAALLEQIARKRKKLGTDSVFIGSMLAEKLFGLPIQDVFAAVQKSSKLHLFPSSVSSDPIIVAADDPYCQYHCWWQEHQQRQLEWEKKKQQGRKPRVVHKPEKIVEPTIVKRRVEKEPEEPVRKIKFIGDE